MLWAIIGVMSYYILSSSICGWLVLATGVSFGDALSAGTVGLSIPVAPIVSTPIVPIVLTAVCCSRYVACELRKHYRQFPYCQLFGGCDNVPAFGFDINRVIHSGGHDKANARCGTSHLFRKFLSGSDPGWPVQCLFIRWMNGDTIHENRISDWRTQIARLVMESYFRRDFTAHGRHTFHQAFASVSLAAFLSRQGKHRNALLYHRVWSLVLFPYFTELYATPVIGCRARFLIFIIVPVVAVIVLFNFNRVKVDATRAKFGHNANDFTILVLGLHFFDFIHLVHTI